MRRKGKLGVITLQDERALYSTTPDLTIDAWDEGSSASMFTPSLVASVTASAKALENQRDLQIHDELGSLALAGFAHAEHLLAHGLKEADRVWRGNGLRRRPP